jgi:hypothetical protein
MHPDVRYPSVLEFLAVIHLRKLRVQKDFFLLLIRIRHSPALHFVFH